MSELSSGHRDPSEMIRNSSRQPLSSQLSDVVLMPMNEGAQDDSAIRSALPASVFLNPLDPNVTVEPIAKRKKGKKAPKKMARTKAAPSSGTSNPQPDQKLTGFALRHGRSRAALLKEKYPSMAGQIPHAISKQMRQTLTKQFTAAKIIPQTHKKVNGVSARQSMLKKVVKELGPRSNTKKSKKAKGPTIAGSASNVPITIG